MFKYIASNPLADAILAPANPELRAHGFINNSLAPACPTRCSFPAFKILAESNKLPRNTTIKYLRITYYLLKIC